MHSRILLQTIILSTTVTLAVVGTALYAFKEPIVDYMQVTSTDQFQSSVHKRVESSNSFTGDIPAMIERVNPAVVSVVVTKDVPVYEEYLEEYRPFGFFGGFQIPRMRENGTEEREVGGGSGFIISNDGMIVTNRHVVDDANARYSVLLNDGTVYETEVLARDPQLDIAILQVSERLIEPLTYVTFGDSESLQLGQPVVAIGNALAEFRNSVSVGVVSGLARSIVASNGMGQSEQLDQVIQTDAAINPGNSGGPLLNTAGEVIGVNVATSRGADNISFALPAHVVKAVVDSVEEYGEIVRPFLGVRYTMVTPRMAEQNAMEYDYGALVLRGQTPEALAVMPGSPADRVGITENTVILSIDGEELRDTDLATILRRKSVGQTITLQVFQDGITKEVELVLGRTPST